MVSARPHFLYKKVTCPCIARCLYSVILMYTVYKHYIDWFIYIYSIHIHIIIYYNSLYIYTLSLTSTAPCSNITTQIPSNTYSSTASPFPSSELMAKGSQYRLDMSRCKALPAGSENSSSLIPPVGTRLHLNQ